MTEDEFENRTKHFALRGQANSSAGACRSSLFVIEGRAVSPKPPQLLSPGVPDAGRTVRRNVPALRSAPA